MTLLEDISVTIVDISHAALSRLSRAERSSDSFSFFLWLLQFVVVVVISRLSVICASFSFDDELPSQLLGRMNICRWFLFICCDVFFLQEYIIRLNVYRWNRSTTLEFGWPVDRQMNWIFIRLLLHVALFSLHTIFSRPFLCWSRVLRTKRLYFFSVRGVFKKDPGHVLVAVLVQSVVWERMMMMMMSMWWWIFR